MIPVFWQRPEIAYLWEVILHSLVAAGVVSFWLHHLRVPPGGTRRSLLALVLVLPLLTAALPGRRTWEFRQREAWFDSYRVLGIPLPFGLGLHHLVVLGLATSAAAGFVQELLPVVRRLKRRPEAILAAREQEVLSALMHGVGPGPVACLRVPDDDHVHLAFVGTPWRPTLEVSRGALESLPPDQLGAVLAHERAHLRRGPWLASHGLFLLRLLQLPNPVALWVFREYGNELEIDCDAHAAAEAGSGLLARALLEIYERTERGDLAGRATLRYRIDVLLGRDGAGDPPPAAATVVAVAAPLAILLPWVV